MKTAARLIAIAGSALMLLSANVQAEDNRITVVELFTSQGCNSCPPADRLMGELVKRDDVLGLSFHVDYWDYIGWRDTFSLPESSTRQRNYVGRAGGRYAYTPQIVIGGQDQVVGSRSHSVETAIRNVKAPTPVEISTQPLGDGQYQVHLQPRDLNETAWVWLVTFDSRHDVEIKRGENGGKTLSYFNVVRKIERIATWDGSTGLMVPVDMRRAWSEGRDGCAVIVQAGGFGPVLGAVQLANPQG
ncbi:DUF1223 domain-containing protein [Minwuia sp.]|uniref:DUF1223 domain-containing protein n=1 Tax=Minwuia sp. TaxID=2493630 RepID=UPI003A8CCED2